MAPGVAQVDAAAKQILDLMEPGDDAVREERKRAQLRELALLNGTVRVRVPCARTSHRTAAGLSYPKEKTAAVPCV